MTSREEILPTPEIKYSSYHWGPFLFHTQVTPAECQMVLEEGKKCRQKSNDHRQHLAGHLKEEYRFPDPGPMAGWLKKYLLAYASAYKQWRNQPSTNLNFRLTTMWINYMKANEFNPPHNHEADLSFVLYPHVPDEIAKENKEFKGTTMGPGGIAWLYGESGVFTINVVSGMPVTGDLFFFPSFVSHWVYPFKSNVERVSVSGNVIIIK